MATVQEAIDQIAADLRALTGIRGAPDEPPEQMAVYPFIVCYTRSGSWEIAPVGVRKGLHNIAVELHVARKDLARDVQGAMAYSDSVPNALLKALTTSGDRFASTISTFQRISYTFGPMEWAGQATIGFRWTLEGVKIENEIT